MLLRTVGGWVSWRDEVGGVEGGRLTGWVPLTSFMRWMSRTSGRSLRRLCVPFALFISPSAFWRSFARGCACSDSSSMSISSAEDVSSAESPAAELRRRFFFACLLVAEVAHSGIGYNRSYLHVLASLYYQLA